MHAVLMVVVLCLAGYCQLAKAGTKSKPHSVQGTLDRYDGKHIPYTISLEDNAKLEAGLPVTLNERSGKNGRGIAIQDIAAPPHLCMDRIGDLTNYPKMVPKVKKVEIYEENKFDNGTTQIGAAFNVGLGFMGFSYYLLLRHEPKYQTFTWTLDYRYSSDFDDNVGHWQVMPHPTKEGWSRVLYSCAVQLPSWVPEFVITFLTKTAIVESTTWVRKESEKLAADPVASGQVAVIQVPDVRACFVVDDVSARYEVSCSEGEGSMQGSVRGSGGSIGSIGSGGVGSIGRWGGSGVMSGDKKSSVEVESGSGSSWSALWGGSSDSKGRGTAVSKGGEIGTIEDLERTRLSYERFMQAKR